MNVCFIITGLSVGGAEMMLYNLLRQSASLRRGTVISLISGGEMADRIKALGVRVETLGMRPGRLDIIVLWRLVCLLRIEKFDVVSSWMYHADFLGGIAARFVGVPVVWGLHNSTLDKKRSKKMTRVLVRFCALLSSIVPQKIISCSRTAKDVHVRKGYDSKKIVIIPNGFDLEKFIPSPSARISVRSEIGIPMDAPLVGLVARFDPQKNHFGFLKAAREVFSSVPNVHFILAGSKVDWKNSKLVGEIEKLGLVQNIHLLGLRDDIAHLMASLDVLVSSSSYGEAFPIVLGEAMACGIPCVATDVGDSSLLVGDAGEIVSPDAISELAQAILKIINSSARDKDLMKRKARRRIIENFSIAHIARLYENVLQDVINSHVRHSRNIHSNGCS